MLESTVLNKVMNILLDTPRISALTVLPRGFPRGTQFDLGNTLGG
jgi:hypothetical protein